MSYQLIEMLKSSENVNKWDDVVISIRSGLKESNDKMNQISQSLMLINNHINKSDRYLCMNRDKPFNYIKMICKQKKLAYSETPRNGLSCLELTGDCFRIVVVIQDTRLLQMSSKPDLIKQVLIEYNKEKPTSCPELQKSLSEGDYSLLLVHIEELVQLYSVGNDRTQQLKAFLCLQSLEEDINKLSQCPIIVKPQTDRGLALPSPTNIIGTIKPRSGGIPSKFCYYNGNSVVDCERFNITVQLMSHHENNQLPFIPLVNLQKDAKGNCIPSYVTADSLKCVPLAAKFVLKLSQPMILSETNMLAISSITGLSIINAGEKSNYVDLLCEQAGSALTFQDRFYSILPNDSQLVFQILNETPPFGALVVTSIPFLLPSQLTKIVAIIKKQAIVNKMMESFLLSNSSEEFERDSSMALQINVTIISHDEVLCSFTTSGCSDSKIKLSISYNEYGQSNVRILSRKFDQPILESLQKVTQKYNNLPMVIFWLLHRSGDLTLKESPNFVPNSLIVTDQPSNKIDQKEADCKFLEECITQVRANLNIQDTQNKEIFPKIVIEPKLELFTTTSQLLPVNSPSTLVQHEVANVAVTKTPTQTSSSIDLGLTQNQDFQNTFQNPYLQHPNICHQSAPNSISMPNNSISCNQSSQQNSQAKADPYPAYNVHGTKHMSLDQMLSSDFAMPFASDGMGSFNPLSHAMHYSEHSSSAPASNNIYGSHMAGFRESPNSKSARQLDTQSSVLVNLLNCNESTASSNSNMISRQISSNLNASSCYPPNAYLSDQLLDPSKGMQSQMLRGSQMPRMRMPHPNQVPKSSLGTGLNGMCAGSPLSLPLSRPSAPPKADIMMMPYPQDTGSVRGASVRKPRKRRAPNLELNQRLPKMPSPQFPMLQQPTPGEAMHLLPGMQLGHGPPLPSQQPPPQPSPSAGSQGFSSPTAVDQSVYDFDDNVEFSRSRGMPCVAFSGPSPHGHTHGHQGPPGTAPVPRRGPSSGPASKKPIKVKISRKVITQPPGTVAGETLEPLVPLETDPRHRDKPSLARSAPAPGPGRPTAIMTAIDSPLTCSSISSMQASPYGSGTNQHSLPGNIGDGPDGTAIKKRRKRRLKLEHSDDAESALKREKLEIRKMNKKKKELGSGLSSHGSMESLQGLVGADCGLKPPPLPIKLSVNAKMGSVSTSGGGGGTRTPRLTPSASCPALNPGGATWTTQQKAPKAETKATVPGEPILKNYKIPKKKAAAAAPEGPQELPRASSPPPPPQQQPDLGSVNSLSTGSSNDPDPRQTPDCTPGLKPRSIHDIADRLLAKTSSTVTATVPCESVLSSGAPSADLSLSKMPDFNQSLSDNIFDKLSSSKPNPKPEFRPFATGGGGRPPDPSVAGPRYPYGRAPGPYQPRGPVAPPGPFNYGVRQPYSSGGQGVFRMDSTGPRTVAPGNPNGGLQYHKKGGGGPNQFPNRKK